MFLCEHELPDQDLFEITTAGNTLTFFRNTALFPELFFHTLVPFELPVLNHTLHSNQA
jgi:hypothetical protein